MIIEFVFGLVEISNPSQATPENKLPFFKVVSDTTMYELNVILMLLHVYQNNVMQSGSSLSRIKGKRNGKSP